MEFQDLRNSPEDDNFEEEGAKDGEERGVMTQTEVGEKAMEEEEEEEEEGGGERKNAEGGEIKSAQMKNKRKKKDKGTEKKQSGSRGLTKLVPINLSEIFENIPTFCLLQNPASNVASVFKVH